MASGNIVVQNPGSVGLRFHPTNDEIFSYFLKNKMFGNEHLVQAISEVDLCEQEPWDLPDLSGMNANGPKWFFFCICNFNDSQRRRSKRATKAGSWKVSGKKLKIKAERTRALIGSKKIFVFYRGHGSKAVSTNWVMHEYRSVDTYPEKPVYVVRRLRKREGDGNEENVDNSANAECQNENLDSNLQSMASGSAMPLPEASLEESALQWLEANNSMLVSSSQFKRALR